MKSKYSTISFSNLKNKATSMGLTIAGNTVKVPSGGVGIKAWGLVDYLTKQSGYTLLKS